MEPVPNPNLPPAELSRGSRRILRALTEVLTPPEPAVPECTARVQSFVASFLPYLPPLSARLLPLGLWLFEYGTLIFGLGLLPFSRLSPEKRRRYIIAWQRSRSSLRRQLVKGLKALILMGYYELPEVQRHVGYDPEPFIKRLAAERAQRYERRGLVVVAEPHAPPSPGNVAVGPRSEPRPKARPEADA